MNKLGIAVVEIVEVNIHRLLYANEFFLNTRACTIDDIRNRYDGDICQFLDMESKIKMNIIMAEMLKYRKCNINYDIKVNCNNGTQKELLCKGKLIYGNGRTTMNIIETDITGVSENLAAGIL